MIDLDTVMPGIVHYDFGDAIRSACNTAGEETRNLEEVSFNMAFFEAFTAGFMEKAKHLFNLKDVYKRQRVLSNVKIRGTIGEVQLSMLLEQVLAPEQYNTCLLYTSPFWFPQE